MIIVLGLLLSLFLPGFLVKDDTLVLGGSTSVFTMFNGLSDIARTKKLPFIYNSMGSFAAVRAVEREIFLVGFMSKKPPTNLPVNMKTKHLVDDGILVIYHLPDSCRLVDLNGLNAEKKQLRQIYLRYQD